MAKTATIDVDSELIRWARESSGLSVLQAAKRVGVKPRLFEEWEGTAGRPTARQLERLADAVKRPVATFFMPTPPMNPLFQLTPGSHLGRNANPCLRRRGWRSVEHVAFSTPTSSSAEG